jgi:hypothetical protein
VANPILIAVPQHLVPAVAELIATDGASAGTDASGDLVNGWVEDTLRQHYRDSSEKMRGFLVLLANSGGQEVTSEEAARALGYPDWNSIAGMLGAAQRRARNRFGLDYGPWHRRWAQDGHARLKMPAEAGAVVLDEAAKHGDFDPQPIHQEDDQ